MKNLIKISVFFALIILFANSAYAQYNIPDPPPSEGSGCFIPNTDLAHSPSEACQLWERIVYCSAEDGVFAWKISGSDDDCTVTSGYKDNGTFRYYYSGDQYCRERIGSSFNNFKTCVPRTNITQPTSTTKVESVPESQPKTQLEIEQKNAIRLMNENDAILEKESQRIDKMMRERREKDAADSQINQLQTFNDALKNIIDNVGTKLKNWAGSIFDGIKNIFKK